MLSFAFLLSNVTSGTFTIMSVADIFSLTVLDYTEEEASDEQNV